MRLLVNVSQIFLLVTLISRASFSNASAVAAPVSTPVATTKEDGNAVVAIFGMIKDTFVRTIDGGKDMWNNHGKCKEIRAKQKEYREKLKKQWEYEEQGLTPKETRQRLQKINGGITYDEFAFLQKGKDDRGKLMNMLFLMWGAPRLFPYALWFYPEVLPAPFQPMPSTPGKETKLEKLARQRSHAVINTFLSLEKQANEIPAIAKLNIFGGKKNQRNLQKIDNLGRDLASIMTAPGARDGKGAKLALDALDHLLYRNETFTRKEQRLVGVPKSIVFGLMNVINGPAPLNGFLPNPFRRGTVLTHIQKITETDDFLVKENVDINSLSTARLLEACSDRCIGGPGRSDEELRQGLSDWLDLAVVTPTSRTLESGESFNDSLARTALLSYYAVSGTRDSRSASYLPRLMFQGQFEPNSDGKKRGKP